MKITKLSDQLMKMVSQMVILMGILKETGLQTRKLRKILNLSEQLITISSQVVLLIQILKQTGSPRRVLR